jgi:hypothetical protein
MQVVAAAHETARRMLWLVPLGFQLTPDAAVHEEPFHTSASAPGMNVSLVNDWPDAVHAVSEKHETPYRGI